MGLCETSNFSIFTFSCTGDLKVCTRSYSNCLSHDEVTLLEYRSVTSSLCKHFHSNLKPHHESDEICVSLDILIISTKGPPTDRVHKTKKKYDKLSLVSCPILLTRVTDELCQIQFNLAEIRHRI